MIEMRDYDAESVCQCNAYVENPIRPFEYVFSADAYVNCNPDPVRLNDNVTRKPGNIRD